uniref:Cyclin N-terminal domain-containing protein n=1 Tax=Octactis speculum TaxID=3111310 RepID=A0A7S2GN01_9STRA|mmetsp:Transcript_50876/g.69241  ORF Transcript_50876/g.69241 Transcript_50876/m.69241 type:complete len:441 (+) Transcript_50876:92-1414(+)
MGDTSEKSSGSVRVLRSGRRVLTEVTNTAPVGDHQSRQGNGKKARLHRNPVESSSSSARSSIAEADPLRNEKIQEICKWIENEDRENHLLEWVFQLDSDERTDLINMVIDAMGSNNEVSSKSLMSAVRKSSHKWPPTHIRDFTNWINMMSQQERSMDVDEESQSTDLEVQHCDEADRDNPLAVVEYIEELYHYYKKAEQIKAPAMYMHRQSDITPRMRSILIDWLVEVHLKFKLVPATLYLCVHLIDQFCSSNDVLRGRLQLVGITALLIACKYEEIYPPEVRDCVYITDHAYTREEVLSMETEMLQHFEYNITVPTGYQFLIRYLKVMGCTPKEAASFRASYYAERSLQEHDMLLYKPSLVAAASVYLALKSERPDPWGRVIEKYSGYSLEQITPCARQICHYIRENPVTPSRRPLTAVKKKFETQKFLRVAEDPDPVI